MFVSAACGSTATDADRVIDTAAAAQVAPPEPVATPTAATPNTPPPPPAATPPLGIDTPAPTATITPIPTPTPTSTPTPSAWQQQAEAIIEPWVGPDLELSVSIVTQDGVVFEHEPELLLFPASNQKLLTAVGAYELLDSALRFRTDVRSTSQPEAGIVDGDLVLVAGGDPTLTTADLGSLAGQVRSAGVTVVTGDVVIDASRYDDAIAGPGWQDWQLPAHVGPMSALVLDDNRWRSDDAYVNDPALANGERFVQALIAVGIEIRGRTVQGSRPGAQHDIASHQSAELGDLITIMLYNSDNEIAEAVTREIAYEATGLGSTTTGLATITTHLESLGFSMQGANGDGSGLSRLNLHTADDWRRLLEFAGQRDWFPEFFAALPRSGESGTMAERLTGPDTYGRVVAKTGTIIGGRSLSGYALRPDGSATVFSIIVNGSRSDAAITLIDDLVMHLFAD